VKPKFKMYKKILKARDPERIHFTWGNRQPAELCRNHQRAYNRETWTWQFFSWLLLQNYPFKNMKTIKTGKTIKKWSIYHRFRLKTRFGNSY
jgi:hypothetical protein